MKVVPSHRLRQLQAKPRRVEVEWIDSAGRSGWQDANELLDSIARPDSLTCWTVGYLVDESPEHITVALSYTVDSRLGLHEQYGEPLTIPRSALVDVHDLRR